LSSAYGRGVPEELENLVGKCGTNVENDQIFGEAFINMPLISGGRILAQPADLGDVAISHVRRELPNWTNVRTEMGKPCRVP
jgi:hypothetical protein